MASARAALGGCSLIALYLDPEPMPYAVPAYTVLVLYACLGFAFFAWARRQTVPSPIIALVHGIDILFIVLISAFVQDPTSPSFFVFFTIVVLSAAYRWGLWETVLTGAIFLILSGSLSAALIGNLDLTRFLVRFTYLSLVTLLIGYLAEHDKGLKEENSSIARLLQICQTESELGPTIRKCLNIIGDFYQAKGALLIVQENTTHRVFRWQHPASLKEMSSRPQELDSEEAGKYLFYSPVQIWCWQNLRSGADCRTSALDSAGALVRQLRFQAPESLVAALSCDSLLALAFSCGDDLAGRLYILDPQLDWLPSRQMHYLSRLLNEVRPMGHNIYLWRRVRSKAHIIEQVRAAREIHDGIIQSLTGLELEIESMLLRNGHDAASRRQLERVQQVLREQSQNVRDLMHRMKTPAVTSRELIPFLENLVTKFDCETGIKARFVCDTEAPPLPAKTCHEIARIVQEALINVRKHARASHVDVELSSDRDGLKLLIEDDGPSSRLEGWQYEDGRVKKPWEPAVIRERVLLLKGTLRIESRPGSETRLMIKIPTSAYSQSWVHDGATNQEFRPAPPL